MRTEFHYWGPYKSKGACLLIDDNNMWVDIYFFNTGDETEEEIRGKILRRVIEGELED